MTNSQIKTGLSYAACAASERDHEDRWCVSLRLYQNRNQSRSGEDDDLSLHGLPDGHGFRVPRLGSCIRGIVQDVRAADELSQDHGGERSSAAADLLPPLRLADLFHHAGRGAAGVLHGACWYPA